MTLLFFTIKSPTLSKCIGSESCLSRTASRIPLPFLTCVMNMTIQAQRQGKVTSHSLYTLWWVVAMARNLNAGTAPEKAAQ